MTAHDGANFQDIPQKAKTRAPWETLTIGQKLKWAAMMLLRAFLIALAIVFVGTYVLFSPPVFVSVLAPKVLLFPMPPGAEYQYTTMDGIPVKEVFFTNSAGNKLHGFYWKAPGGAKKTVLFMHGNAGNIGHRLLLAKAIKDAGASIFLFDYRGYGKSEGKSGVAEIIDDSKCAYDYLENELKVAPKDIVLYGESIGGAVACALAKDHKSGGLILDSTFTSLLRIAKKKIWVYNMYPDFLESSPSLNNIEYLSHDHPPLLIIHGQLDEILPLSEAQANFQAATEPKKFVPLPGSTHNNKGADGPLYLKTLKDFLSSLPE